MRTLLLTCIFAFAATASAAEYFVSTRGNDAVAGTSESAPLATIGKGASMLKAGDTLTILPGEYREAVEVKKLTGTKDAPVTIRAQREGTVLLRGDVEVADWKAVPGMEGVFSTAFKDDAQGVADPRTTTHFPRRRRGRNWVRSQARFSRKPGAGSCWCARSMRGRDPVFRTRPVSVIRKGDWKLHLYHEEWQLDGGREKLTANHAVELYNVAEDIGERNDVANANPAKRDELLDDLLAWIKMVRCAPGIAAESKV
jgi:hypothetical protein